MLKLGPCHIFLILRSKRQLRKCMHVCSIYHSYCDTFLHVNNSEPAKIAYKIFHKIYTCCFIFTPLLLPIRLFLASECSTCWTNAYTFLSQSKINLLLLTKARKANTRKNINNACALCKRERNGKKGFFTKNTPKNAQQIYKGNRKEQMESHSLSSVICTYILIIKFSIWVCS